MEDRSWRVPEPSELRLALAEGSSAVARLLEGAHPADVAHWLGELDAASARAAFDAIEPRLQGRVIVNTKSAVMATIVTELPVRRLAALAEELPPDEVADMLALVDPRVADNVLARLDEAGAHRLRRLLDHGSETAGGIMTTDFDAFPSGTRVGDAIKYLKRTFEVHGEEGTGVYVLDADARPIGHVTERELITSPIHALLDDVMERALVLVSTNEDQETVALRFAKYRLPSLPVVDAHGVLVGVVTADDVLHVLEEEAREDFQRLVGASGEEQTYLPVRRRVWQRLPLMVLTVLGGLATAKVLDLAMSNAAAGSEHADLLDFMRYVPIILGLAGNVGIQSSTILVRGLATGEVTEQRERSVMTAEIATGAAIGLLCGLVTGLVAAFIEAGDGPAWSFALSIGVAIAIAVAWAALLGCLVPVACRRLGVDPAVAAGPSLITLSDLSATAIYILVAQVVSGLVEVAP